MKIAIMQPYFFPYIGQFQLINAVNRFILADDVQYIRHGWINRNRILKPADGHYYMIMPVEKHSTYTCIKNIKVVSGFGWKEKILRQVEHYKMKAPYYKSVYNFLVHCFHTTNDTSIARLNGAYLKYVCDFIGIDFEVEISSEIGLPNPTKTDKDERVISMCQRLQATEFINPPGGMRLYNKDRFMQQGLVLRFLKPDIFEYNQYRDRFDPELSIIDVMMFNSPEEIRLLLGKYQLL